MIDAAAVVDLRDELEDKADKVVGAALRRFLKQATKVATSRTSALTAAAVPLPEGSGPLTLGELAAWWAALVEGQVTPELKAMFWTAYLAHRDGLPPFADPEEVAAGYMARVSDRLVRGLTPPVYEESFDRIRSSIALSQAQSWSRKDLAQRIAAELSWEQKGAYWRSEKTRIDSQIDAILDPLGQPGTQAREIARLSDPRVQALRNDRNRVIRRLDDEQSYWHNRSTLIARTEATGVANHAALRALAEEGVKAKEWLSVADSRTRDSHSEANGQVVALEQPFTVGGFQLMAPGDPGAPVQETANCRCSIVGADADEVAGDPPPPDPDLNEDGLPWPEDMTQEELDAEVERLMSEGDFDSPRMLELSREMESRDRIREARELEEEKEQWKQEVARAARSDPRAARLTLKAQREQLRMEYDLMNEHRFLKAEAELNGVLLSREGRAAEARGELDVRDFFNRTRTSTRWMSEELQRWLASNPSLSFSDFEALQKGEGADRIKGRTVGEWW